MRGTAWFASVLVLFSVGCGNSATVPVASNSTHADVALQRRDTDSAEASPPAVQVDIKSWDEIQRWVASQRGKVVVVDVWSTWCVPCVKEFPHFVALHEASGSEIVCASLNLDYYGSDDEQPEDVKPRVLKFLTSKRASMQNFISSDPDEKVLDEIQTAAIPASIVYARDGTIHTIFNNDSEAYGPEGFTYESDITPLVKQLRNQPPE